jgi:hypothetical protein
MRVLWVLLMIVGVVVLGAMGVGRLYGLYLIRGEPDLMALRFVPTLLWSSLFLMGAGACAAGIFMRPSEFRDAMEEPPAERAPWLDELKPPSQGEDRDP